MRETKRFISLFCAIALIAGISVQLLPPSRVQAATQISPRNLLLEPGTYDSDGDGIPDGGSLPSGHVSHLFTFQLTNTAVALGSIKFQYCTTAAPVPGGIGCVAPTGIDVSGVNLSNQTGATGFSTTTKTSEDDAADGVKNEIIIGRGSAANLSSATSVSYEFTGVVNPSAVNTTFFVRISTYNSLDGSGSSLESGTVAASTTSANNLKISGTMPESLVFCTGAIISLTAGVPDCTTATAGIINFNALFSPTSTAFATSQMAASTNAGQGYAITVNGPTLTSGSNTINAMSTTDTSKYGISQFGLNLVLNDGTAYTNAPNITNMASYNEADSANIAPASNATNYNGAPSTGFDTTGSFSFTAGTPNTVAASDYNNPGTAKGTDAQIYTASYIVNVPGSQPAGTYSTTLTYICTPTF